MGCIQWGGGAIGRPLDPGPLYSGHNSAELKVAGPVQKGRGRTLVCPGAAESHSLLPLSAHCSLPFPSHPETPPAHNSLLTVNIGAPREPPGAAAICATLIICSSSPILHHRKGTCTAGMGVPAAQSPYFKLSLQNEQWEGTKIKPVKEQTAIALLYDSNPKSYN